MKQADNLIERRRFLAASVVTAAGVAMGKQAAIAADENQEEKNTESQNMRLHQAI